MFSLHYIMAACKIMLNLMLLLVLISAVVNGETSSNGSTPPFQNVSVTTPKIQDQSETSAKTVTTTVSPPPTTTGTRTTPITSATNTADSTCTMDITYFSDHISDFTETRNLDRWDQSCQNWDNSP